ncbi:unnamed protein product, partial [Effrenium voratum]
ERRGRSSEAARHMPRFANGWPWKHMACKQVMGRNALKRVVRPPVRPPVVPTEKYERGDLFGGSGTGVSARPR